MIKKLTLTAASLLVCFLCFSQNIRNEKFGVIKVDDFSPKSSILTNDDDAIVLSDVGSSEFVGNNNGYFTILYKRHKKILIKKKTAFDRATVEVKLYQGNVNTEEVLDNLEAATHNLENGMIVSTKLNKESIIKEKFDKLHIKKKFTLPNVKEGSIIEYSFTIKKQDDRLSSWYFQDDCPTLWSEYQVTIPPMFNYVVVKNGDYKKLLVVDSMRKIFKNYAILIPGNGAYSSSSIQSFSGDAKWALWAMKDVPAYKKESFVANHSQYITAFNFQLHSIRYSEINSYQVIKSWFQTASDLLKSEWFGQLFDKEKNEWVENEATKIVGETIGIDAAKKIFTSVRDEFMCDDHFAILLSDDVKKIYKQKKGSVADINLLLTAMLKSKGFTAEPVILSTRGNGKITETTAMLNEFDYTICQLNFDSTIYYLDASNSKNGFGKLPSFCYNGYGRVITQIPNLINLSADYLRESKTTTIFIANNDSNKMEASFESRLGLQESNSVREELSQNNTKAFFSKITKGYSFEVKTENEEIENLKNYDEPIAVKYDMKFSIGDDDIIYFNPLLAEITKENIFKAEKRVCPVEMPFLIDETYILDMEIPKGYVVDEMPKSVRSKLNENEGLFEYLITNKSGRIQLRCKFKLEKSNYEADDYESLRSFFGLMINKQAEQIVFKKVK
ncbi:MAG: DUF3858 domain-containing protein [Chitinophagaceae bacterium]